MDRLTASRQNRISLSSEDCENLMRLMNNGFTLPDAMHIAEDRRNRQCMQMIQTRLQNGEQISEFFVHYCSPALKPYFSGFIHYLSFQQSLQLSIAVVNDQRKQTDVYRKGLVYPCMMLIMTVLGAMVFNTVILPSLNGLMSSFHTEGTDFKLIQLIIQTAAILIAAVSASAVCLYIYLKQKRNMVKGYCALQKIFPNSIWIQKASQDFVRFFLECIRMDIKTKQSMEILKGMTYKPLVAFIASEIDRSLMDGDRIESAMDSIYIDPSLKRFFKIALYSSDMENMLQGYLEMCSYRLLKQSRIFTKAVQAVSYCSIGLILIVVYQALMLPMTMLSQM